MAHTASSWVVARASQGQYDPGCFRLQQQPVRPPSVGEVLVESRLLSLDPTHLNWVKLDPALQYIPIGVGDAMLGTNIGIVRQSADPRFQPGQLVMGLWGWSTHALANADLLGPALPEDVMPLEDQLIVLSHVGQAAAGGLLLVGQAKQGDRVLVSAAAGATGSIAAQLARSLGCYTVGIAGSEEKCRHLVEELGLDAAIDYRTADVPRELARHFPEGVDVYFDNVGGQLLDDVLSHMARGCRIVVCGAIAQYDSAGRAGNAGLRNVPMLIFKQARMEGFVAGQFGERNGELVARLLQLYREGRLRVRSHVVDFESIPSALELLLSGRNTGKLMARVAGAGS